jgi:K+-transporting ATPase ATPase C chain
MTIFLQSCRLLLVLTVLTGAIYPFAVWAIGQVFFHHKAGGSLVVRDGQLVGSSLLAQPANDPRYFQPRPSAANYATVASGASNQAWTSARLALAIAERRAAQGNDVAPADLLTASGSGLDPHLTPEGVRAQFERVAAARGLTPAQRRELDERIAMLTEGGQVSPRRVNVLHLNLALDAGVPR